MTAEGDRTAWWRVLVPRTREQRAWVLYDCANSAFFTTVVTAVFPVYFRNVAAAGRTDVLALFGTLTSAALLSIALLGPWLGALADARGHRKRFLAAFVLAGACATASLAFVGEGDWKLACALYALANIGVAGSLVFYDALLPAVAREDELDRVSSQGYAIGYLGGGVLLALNVAWIVRPDLFGLPAGTLPARLAFVSVALWWLAFTIPLLARVREPATLAPANGARDGAPMQRSSARAAFAQLASTWREAQRFRAAFLVLAAMLVYGDGINTIIRMAVVYGEELGLDQGGLILAVLLVQFVGVPCALAFGRLAGRIGAKRAILVGLGGYLLITLFAATIETSRDFYVLACGVGVVQGGCQALSRSLFASLVPPSRSAQFFGLFGVLERFSSVLGPLAFAWVASATGNPRYGVLVLLVFFVGGAWILTRVDVEAGRRAARDAEGDAPRE